jgi:hypothetical protein
MSTVRIVAREQLVENSKMKKGLADAVVICELWKLAVAM